jgi:hypothetical protein
MSERSFLTSRELAERWRLPEQTVRRWRCIGAGPVFTRIGRSIRYAIGDVLAFEDTRRAGITTVRADGTMEG